MTDNIDTIVSKESYKIYNSLKKKYYGKHKDEHCIILNSISSAIILFMINEIKSERYDLFFKNMIKNFEENLEIVKSYMLKNDSYENKDAVKEGEDDPEDNYVFSKELRERLGPFGKMNIGECLQDPEFYNALLDLTGLSEEDKDRFKKDYGLYDLANDIKNKEKMNETI